MDFMVYCIATDFRYWRSRSDIMEKRNLKFIDFDQAGKSRFLRVFSCSDFITCCCIAMDFRYWKSHSDVMGK